jgi:DNA-binding transcriptional ArsR family regulator
MGMAQRRPQGSDLLETSAASIAEIFKALSDTTRLRIIVAILEKERCVHDLCKELDLEQSAVSHQLRVLRNKQLVRHRKEGRHVYYGLDDGHVRDLLETALEHVSHGGKRGRR